MKSLKKLPKKARKAAMAEMDAEGKLYRKSCRTGKRRKEHGTEKGWGKSCIGKKRK